MTRRGGKVLFRYALVGVANTILYSALLWGFLSIGGWPYPVLVAYAFGIAMCFQYLANKFFTFGGKSVTLAEVARYLSAAGVNYLVSVFFIWLCLDRLGMPALTASVISAVTAAGCGYLLASYWVYAE